MSAQIAVDPAAVAALCRRHRIRKLSIFGSALRDDFRPESDVDLLVRWRADAHTGFDVLDVEDDLSALFGGRRVDLVNEEFLNHRLRDRILSSAEALFDEG